MKRSMKPKQPLQTNAKKIYARVAHDELEDDDDGDDDYDDVCSCPVMSRKENLVRKIVGALKPKWP